MEQAGNRAGAGLSACQMGECEIFAQAMMPRTLVFARRKKPVRNPASDGFGSFNQIVEISGTPERIKQGTRM
jgi:hypothetical protein